MSSNSPTQLILALLDALDAARAAGDDVTALVEAIQAIVERS